MSGDETDTSSDDEHAVSIEDLLRSAADDEELTAEVDHAQDTPIDGSNDDDGDGWPEDFRTEEEIAARGHTREPEAPPEAAAQDEEGRAGDDVAAREQEVGHVEPATVGERERGVTTTREFEEGTASLGKRKEPIEPDLSELSEEEPLPPPQPIRTKQANRGSTVRKPPTKKKKR
jgi:hypothetical protein